MKTILFTLIALPMLASAQNITRSGKINIPGIGLITVEAQVAEEMNGSTLSYSKTSEV